MPTRRGGTTVLLGDEGTAERLARSLPATEPVKRYASVGRMVAEEPLDTVAVLVLAPRGLPMGALLATLGRMSLEFPAMQKVAVLDGPPPLPLAGYLAACGVDLVWGGAPDEGSAAALASVVHRMHERAPWLAS